MEPIILTELKTHKGGGNYSYNTLTGFFTFSGPIPQNAHQPTRRKEKCLIKFKSPQGAQRLISLMGKVRNIFSVDVGRYTKTAPERKVAFGAACAIWTEAALCLLYI